MDKNKVTESNAHRNKKEMLSYIEKINLSSKIKEVIREMLEVILLSGKNDINLDFEDLKVIMSHGGELFGGTGEYEGENSANEAIKLAIKDSTLDFNLLDKVTGILIHLQIHPGFPIMEIGEAMELINDNAHYDADIIWGTSASDLVGEKYVKVTVLFAKFKENVVANIAKCN